MICREDYYKFAHKYLPNTFFKYGEIAINMAVDDKLRYAEKLKQTWKSMQLEGMLKKKYPSFEIDIKNIDEEYSLIIIEIPEARKAYETPFIGVLYNKEYNVRYFTYEIAEEFGGENAYFLCEWTEKWDHINHCICRDRKVETFITALDSTLICELL